MEPTTTQKPQVSEDLTLTARAAAQILRIKGDNKVPEGHGLRIGVKGGGCSGLSYVLGFDAEPKPNDVVFVREGVTVFVDPKSLFYISGTVLDFSDGLDAKGFVFNNPQAAKTCGCGNSFSA